MKKIVSLFLCMIMLIASVCTTSIAALAESDLIGVWNAISAEADGMTMDKSMLEMLGMLIKMTFNEDGTGILEMEGESGEINWSESAESVVISVEGDSLTMNKNADGTLSGDFGGAIIVFEKGNGAAEVAPAADVDTAALLGTWFDGDTTNFTIYNDGTCVATDQYGDSWMDWEVVDGVPMITTGFWCDSPLILNEDGTLYVSDGWSVDKTFTFGAGEIRVGSTLEEPTDVVMAESPDVFYGEWIGETMVMESGTFALADMMMTMNLTINADGTMDLFDGAMTDTASWTFAEGYLTAVDGMVEIALMEDGRLCMAQEFNILYLTRADGSAAPIDPVAPADPDPVETPADLSDCPVVGVWNDGKGVTLTVNADGTCVATDEWGDSNMGWEIVDGVPTITTGSWYGAPMILNDDGTLYVNDGFFINKTLMRGAYVAPDLSTSPVVGVWNDGASVTFTVNADGTCVATDEWGDNNMKWTIQDGVPMITGGSWYGAPMILNDDGTLYVSDGWVVDTTFMPGELTSGNATAPVVSGAVSGNAEDFVGTWNASTMEMEGMVMNVADMGMIMDLTITADGMITMFDGESTEEASWTLADGVLDIMGEMQLTLTEDGRLCMADESAAMYFVRGEASVGGETPVAEEIVPVAGEVEDFVGRWIGASMEVEGMVMALSDIGMTMEITFDAYGTITLYDGEAIQEGIWTLVDGKADIDGMICTLMSDGTLVAEDPDGAKVVFTGFIGTWKACYMSTGGLTGDLRSMGITSTLVLNADGTGSIDFPTPEEGIWYREEGILRFGENGMPMTVLPGGFLKFGSDMSGYIVFSQDETATWDPSMEVVQPAATPEPVATPAPAQAPDSGDAGDLMARMDKKYVAKNYTAFGQTMDASMLGAEYSVLFRENGTCDFGLAGMVVPNLPWGLQKIATGLTEVDAFVINYYGTMFNAVLTAEGFDMDYYGTMTLHFVPAE